MYISVLSTYMSVYQMCAWYPQMSRESVIDSPKTGVMVDCELPW